MPETLPYRVTQGPTLTYWTWHFAGPAFPTRVAEVIRRAGNRFLERYRGSVTWAFATCVLKPLLFY
jgi:hypothetical protein